MATQEQVNALQADLLAAEAAMKAAVQSIRDAANAEAEIPQHYLTMLRVSAETLRHTMGMFHNAAELCCVSTGIQPLSGGQDKD